MATRNHPAPHAAIETVAEELAQSFEELSIVGNALAAVEELLDTTGCAQIDPRRLANLLHPHIEQIGMSLSTLRLAHTRLPDIKAALR